MADGNIVQYFIFHSAPLQFSLPKPVRYALQPWAEANECARSSSSFPTLLPATSSLLLQLLLVQAPPAGPTGTLSGTGLSRFQAAALARRWQVTSPPPQPSCVPSCLSSPLPPSPGMLPEPPPMHVWPLTPLQNSQIQCLEPLPAPQVSAQPGRLCPQVSGCVFPMFCGSLF